MLRTRNIQVDIMAKKVKIWCMSYTCVLSALFRERRFLANWHILSHYNDTIMQDLLMYVYVQMTPSSVEMIKV